MTCIRCGGPLNTYDRFPRCVRCGWEDYGQPVRAIRPMTRKAPPVLAPRRREIMRHLQRHFRIHQYGPTIQEIANACGLIAAVSNVHYHIKVLREAGYVSQVKYDRNGRFFSPRTIHLTEKGRDLVLEEESQ